MQEYKIVFVIKGKKLVFKQRLYNLFTEKDLLQNYVNKFFMTFIQNLHLSYSVDF